MSHNSEIWLGALATLALYSILYRENPVYRFAEHLFVGLATGYGLYVLWKDVLAAEVVAAADHRRAVVVDLCPDGRGDVLHRLLQAIFLDEPAGDADDDGLHGGAGVPPLGGHLREADQLRHGQAAVYAPLRPAARPAGHYPLLFGRIPAPYIHLDNLLFAAILIAVLTYFLFSFEHQSVLVRRTAQVGRWVMMIGFGAIFGSTVMARLSLFIGRLLFLFRDWIPLIPR